jgi:hypothetical protein
MNTTSLADRDVLKRVSKQCVRRYFWAFTPCSLVATLCGCPANSGVQACYGLKIGDRIELSVIEPYDANSQYKYSSSVNSSCENGLDLSGGQTLEATVVDLRGETQCATGIANFGPVGGWSWQLKAYQQPAAGLLLFGSYTATLGQCTGSVEIQVSADATPFVPPVVGQVPHVLLSRNFSGDGANSACPDAGTTSGGGRSCVGTFVVSARKL